MPEEKADELVADIELRCANCDQPVDNVSAHVENRSSFGNGSVTSYASWSCTASNWRERALKAEAELTSCYNEIFYTVPEAMPLIEKIRTMHGMEADVLARLAKVQKELDELKAADKPKKKREPKFEPHDPDLGDLMTWEDFVQHAENGSLRDDDGCASLATETHVSILGVSCGGVESFKRPEWATHVVWYSK